MRVLQSVFYVGVSVACVFLTTPAAANDLWEFRELTWAGKLGGPSPISYPKGVAVDENGAIYFIGEMAVDADLDPGAGNFTSSTPGSGCILKVDADGMFQWGHCIGGFNHVEPKAVVIDNAGNLYVTGRFGSTVDFDPGAGDATLYGAGNDIYLAKYTQNGELIWVRSFGSWSSDEPYGLAVDSQNNPVIAGAFRATVDFDPGPGDTSLTSNGQDDCFVTKFSNTGDHLWTRSAGSTLFDRARAVSTDDEDNVVVTGFVHGPVDFETGDEFPNTPHYTGDDLFIWKLDDDGNYVWATTLGAGDADIGVSIDMDSAGRIFATGFFGGEVDFAPGPAEMLIQCANNTSDAFLLSLEADGTFRFVRHFSSNIVAAGSWVDVDSAGDITLFGNFAGTTDLDPGPVLRSETVGDEGSGFLSRMDNSGMYRWSAVLPVTRAALGENDELVVVGEFEGGAYDLDPSSATQIYAPVNGEDIFLAKLTRITFAPLGTLVTVSAISAICLLALLFPHRISQSGDRNRIR